MKARHIILIGAMAVELILFFYCIFGKSNHVPVGYLSAALAFALFIFTGWLLLFPRVVPIETTGKYGVVRSDSFYTDTSRTETYAKDGGNRELPVSFWYPEDYGHRNSCPLVVFSHGSFGVRESNETLYRELASHGYVVCSIDHTYHCFSTKVSSGKTVHVSGEFMKELGTEDPHKNPELSVKHFKKWMCIRTDDINFVIDTILSKIGEGNDELAVYSLIDKGNIFAIGHSLGGSAVLGVGRQRNDIKGVIALESPFLCDIQGVDEDGKFILDKSDYPVPVLNVYSDSSWFHLKEWSQYEENVRLLQKESDHVKNVYLPGTGHFSLTDLSLSSPFLTMVFNGGSMGNPPQETLKKINELCLEFLNSHRSEK